MGFKAKVMEIQTVYPVDNLPAELPKIPDDVIERFPSMKVYQDNMNTWYRDLSTLLQKQSNEMNDKINTRVKPTPAGQT